MSFHDFRGRGRPWRGSLGPRPSQGPIQTPPAPPLGTLLQKLTPEQCTEDEQDVQEEVRITNVEFLASYNWTDAQDPTILFPGKFRRMNQIRPSLTEQIRHATIMEPTSRSEEAATRLWEILQRPECSSASKSPYGASS
jgi:hypothetical protein